MADQQIYDSMPNIKVNSDLDRRNFRASQTSELLREQQHQNYTMAENKYDIMEGNDIFQKGWMK